MEVIREKELNQEKKEDQEKKVDQEKNKTLLEFIKENCVEGKDLLPTKMPNMNDLKKEISIFYVLDDDPSGSKYDEKLVYKFEGESINRSLNFSQGDRETSEKLSRQIEGIEKGNNESHREAKSILEISRDGGYEITR
jgi:hypothetical protein